MDFSDMLDEYKKESGVSRRVTGLKMSLHKHSSRDFKWKRSFTMSFEIAKHLGVKNEDDVVFVSIRNGTNEGEWTIFSVDDDKKMRLRGVGTKNQRSRPRFLFEYAVWPDDPIPKPKKIIELVVVDKTEESITFKVPEGIDLVDE